MTPALIPSSSAWLPSVAETWVWLISFRLIGRAPICRKVARSCASWMLVKPPEIWAPVRPSIPSGFSAKLMIGRRLDFVVEDDREVAGELFGLFAGGGPDRLRLAALGDAAGDVLEGLAAVVGEAEGDVRLVEFVGFLLRVGDVGARERRVVLEREPAGVLDSLDHLPARVGGLLGDDDRAQRDLSSRFPLCERFWPVGADVEVFLGELGAGDQLVRCCLRRTGSSAVWSSSRWCSRRPAPVRRRG